jgi:hypothetical protein
MQTHHAYMPQTVVVKNNVFGGMGAGQQNIHFDYVPGLWDAGGNVFDPAGVFFWNGNQQSTLSAWQQATSHDLTSRQCRPSFFNQATGDFHLVSTDTCARGTASPLASLFTWDIDGFPRPPAGPWDAGASQVSAPAPPPVTSRFYTLTPCRVVDTRATGSPLTANVPTIFQIANACGVPSSATAVAFNVIAVNTTATVDLQVYPGDRPPLGTNVVSAYPAKPVRAAAAVIPLAGNGVGTVAVLPSFHTAGRVDLLLDVSGYFAP